LDELMLEGLGEGRLLSNKWFRAQVVSAFPGRSIGALKGMISRRRAVLLSGDRSLRRQHWTDEELQRLDEMLPKRPLPIAEERELCRRAAAELPNRSETAILWQMRRRQQQTATPAIQRPALLTGRDRALSSAAQSRLSGFRIVRMRLKGKRDVVEVEPSPHVNVIVPQGLVHEAISAFRFAEPLKQCSEVEYDVLDGGVERTLRLVRGAEGREDQLYVDGEERPRRLGLVGEPVWVSYTGDVGANVQWALQQPKQAFVPGPPSAAGETPMASYLDDVT
jgi:hypothetical protein